MENPTNNKSIISKGRGGLVKFCQILDDLPVNFQFKLTNTGKGLDGPWLKTTLDGVTAWQNGSKILFNSSFYPFKKEVFEAIVNGVRLRKYGILNQSSLLSS